VADERETTRRRRASDDDRSDSDEQGRSGDAPDDSGERRSRSDRPRPGELIRRAVEELVDLTGKSPEGVSAVERDGDQWIVTIDLLELSRVPETTDVLGSYEVFLSADGDLIGYRRTRRYTRSQVEEE
jgi:Gas vesicle synthesis protein GvpO